MTITPDDVLDVMPKGRANGVPVFKLAADVYVAHQRRARADGKDCVVPRIGDADQRKVRAAVEALRRAGHPVCATPEDGYYLAETDEELSSTIAFLRSRAMTSLVQIAQLRRVSLPVLMGQLQMELVMEHYRPLIAASAAKGSAK